MEQVHTKQLKSVRRKARSLQRTIQKLIAQQNEFIRKTCPNSYTPASWVCAYLADAEEGATKTLVDIEDTIRVMKRIKEL